MDWADEDLLRFKEQIYKDFCRIAEEKLRLSPLDVVRTGEIGNHLFDAEFQLFGPVAYATSLILPIRNAWFGYQTVLDRWKNWLKDLKLVPPILDYGCGMGYTLAFLSQILDEEPELYGMELAGVQWGFMSALGQSYGFEPWNNQPVNTVLCLNTLEHLPHPLETLEYLYTLTPNVYGNCDLSEQPSHIAPLDERMACIALLKARGGLIQTEPKETP